MGNEREVAPTTINMVSQVALIVSLMLTVIGAQPLLSNSVEFDIYHPENLPPELPPTPPTLPTERPTRRRRTSQRPTWDKPSEDKNCWKRVCKKKRINGKTRRTCTFVREYIQHL